LYQEEAEEAKKDVEMEIYYLQMDLFKKESEMKMQGAQMYKYRRKVVHTIPCRYDMEKKRINQKCTNREEK
jgi:hypothetical protein